MAWTRHITLQQQAIVANRSGGLTPCGCNRSGQLSLRAYGCERWRMDVALMVGAVVAVVVVVVVAVVAETLLQYGGCTHTHAAAAAEALPTNP
jgi:hypothetical protein